MQFQDLIKERYSCKSFDSSHQVSSDVLTAILEAGRLAPTAKNLQEQHIYVVQSPEALSIVDRHTPCRYGAPTVLVVAFDTNNVYTYPDGKRQSGVEDAAIVATHLMLAAKDNGVESCWLNCVHMDNLRHDLNLPEHEDILMLLDLGYPSPDAAPLANHFSRKALGETVTYL